MNKKCKIGFIGCGKMASAIIKGIISSKFVPVENLKGSEVNCDVAEAAQKRLGIEVLTDNKCLTMDSDVIFVATKPNKKIYVQVAYSIPNEDTKKREFGAYDVINDNYPKYVITLDKLTYEFNGIKHVNLIDFLLDDKF